MNFPHICIKISDSRNFFKRIFFESQQTLRFPRLEFRDADVSIQVNFLNQKQSIASVNYDSFLICSTSSANVKEKQTANFSPQRSKRDSQSSTNRSLNLKSRATRTEEKKLKKKEEEEEPPENKERRKSKQEYKY